MKYLTVKEVPRIEPSAELVQLLKDTANEIVGFVQGWQQILDIGKVEGFSVKELQELFKPYIREKLEAVGYKDKQISDKIYYLFNSEKKALANKTSYEKSRINPNINHNNDIEHCSSPEDTVDYWKQKAQEKDKLLDDIVFEDNKNPDVIRINKTINKPQYEQYEPQVTKAEAIDIFRSELSDDDDARYEIWYRRI